MSKIVSLNESINLDDFDSIESKPKTNVFGVKKIKKTSILDEIIDDTPIDTVLPIQISSEIKVTPTLQEIQNKRFLEEKLSLKAKANLRKSLLLRDNSVNNDVKQQIQNIEIQRQQLPIENQIFIESPEEELANQLIQQYQEETNTVLPENINIVEVVEEIQEAADEIPDATKLSISDFEITEVKKGEGWNKEKVTIKSEVASEELSRIATIVKKATDNIVIHRALDFRVIGNTNKTQLKNSNFKLYSVSYVFKPKPNQKIVAQKYARIILSVPSDYNSTKRVLIYIQESRNKYITEINMDLEFISKLISDYYIVGFEATKSLLKSNSGKNPLSIVVNRFALTRKYLVKPLYDGDGDFNHIIVTTKTGKHQWLKIHIIESAIRGTYKMFAKSKIDSDWPGIKFDHPDGKMIDIDFLLSERVLNNFEKLFNDMDWSKFGMGEDDIENKQYYLMNKITYRSLKKAFIEIYDLSVENPDDGYLVKDVLSQIDTAKDIDSGYKAEVIIGKSNYIDYFILTWSAVQIVGGDKRHGKDYITNDSYYEKYDVKERRDYDEREKTVLKKEGVDRNYNARPFLFTIVYSINNKQYTISAKTFEEIKEKTGFLTKTPIKL
jgi:hypothetical protein